MSLTIFCLNISYLFIIIKHKQTISSQHNFNNLMFFIKIYTHSYPYILMLSIKLRWPISFIINFNNNLIIKSKSKMIILYIIISALRSMLKKWKHILTSVQMLMIYFIDILKHYIDFEIMRK